MINITYNLDQQAVMDNLSGPLMISAGAGTGKTTVIISHLSQILQKQLTTADRVLLVTFTVKAAENMKNKIYNDVGKKISWIGTFHSIALRILRQHGQLINLHPDFQIIDQLQQKKLLSKIKTNLSSNELLETIELYKNTNFTYQIPKSILSAYHGYELLKQNNLDYADILININKLLNLPEIHSIYSNLFDYIYIDEYQDTNILQKAFILKMLGKSQNIICVGDEDQAIYEWRGADLYLVQDFKKTFPNGKILKLEYNYRSTKKILNLANCIISKNINRTEKILKTENLEGENIHIIETDDELHEAITLSSIVLKRQGTSAILCRTIAQTRVITDYLSSQKIDYSGVNFYALPEIQGCIAFLELLLNSENFSAFSKIANIPKRNIGEKKLELIKEQMSKCNLEKAACGLCPALQSLFIALKIPQVSTLMEKLTNILKISGYLEFYNEKKQENIYNFLAKLNKYTNIEEILSEISNIHILKNSKLSVITIHAAKGLEFDNVALAGWNERILPHINAIENQEIMQERRLAYVAITRAKKFLIISVLKRRVDGKLKPSRFLSDLPRSACTWI